MLTPTLSRIVCLSVMVVALAGMAARGAVAQATEPVWPKLTPRLQELLQQEMLSVNDASQQILTALVSGDHDTVADLAQDIHDSFILQRSMTPEDRKHLMNAVPDAFVQLDRSLHETAAALANAAREGDHVRQRQRFSRMVEICMACHSRYATDRFPGLAR